MTTSPITTEPITTEPLEEPVDVKPTTEPPITAPSTPEPTPGEHPAGDAVSSQIAPEESASEQASDPQAAETAMDEGEMSERNPLAGCELCHIDIEDEFSPSLHFAEKVACIDCHGLSDGHIADENNDIKPDVVFTRENTEPLCEECHACDRPEQSRPAEAPAEGDPICTDCHGHHDVVLTVKGG